MLKVQLRIKDIGLAAFMKQHGCPLIQCPGADEKTWVFESEKSAAEWRLEYSNSCCRDHDREVVELKRLKRLQVTP